MKLSLVVLSAGKAEGQTIPVNQPQFLIGRDKQCQLRPNSPLISNRHCAVIVKDNKAWVRDFNSTNGTLVNDTLVKGDQELNDGDILKAGPLTFRVSLEQAAPVKKPAPLPRANQSDLDDDESIAAMLLDDDGIASPIGGNVSEESIPSGSTVMELPVPPGLGEQQGTGDPQKAEEKKKEEKPGKPAPSANSSAAAAEILRTYQQNYRKPGRK